MSHPRQFVYSDRHPPTYISHPVTLGRKYGSVVISDLNSILFQKYSVDSLIPSLNGSVLIVYILWFLTPQRKIKWGIARKIITTSTWQLFYLESLHWPKQYGNISILFPFCLFLCTGAVLNPVTGLLAGLLLLVDFFPTLSALCTTNTYVLLVKKVNSNIFWQNMTGWDWWLSGHVLIDRLRVWFLVEMPRQ